jgi:hypothetical protein
MHFCKYLDIYMNKMDYPTVQGEWKRTSPYKLNWEGICHGWAPASYLYYQPNAVNFKLSDGLVLPFGSSDVKALLAYFLAVYTMKPTTQAVGRRCEAGAGYVCAGMNPGAFHLALANIVGRQARSFVVDIDTSGAVWNQGVVSYSTEVVDSVATTDLKYTVETEPQWEPHPAKFDSRKISYSLGLVNGEIVDGRWLSGKAIDFAWDTARPEFGGYFASLGYIYNTAIAAGVSADIKKKDDENIFFI